MVTKLTMVSKFMSTFAIRVCAHILANYLPNMVILPFHHFPHIEESYKLRPKNRELAKPVLNFDNKSFKFFINIELSIVFIEPGTRT